MGVEIVIFLCFFLLPFPLIYLNNHNNKINGNAKNIKITNRNSLNPLDSSVDFNTLNRFKLIYNLTTRRNFSKTSVLFGRLGEQDDDPLILQVNLVEEILLIMEVAKIILLVIIKIV